MADTLNPQAVEFCVEMIEAEIGNLDDLPQDVASVVAHVYYRAASISPPGPGSTADLTAETLNDFSQVISDAKYIAGFIGDLREMRASSVDEALYGHAVQLLLDIFKYRIPEAHAKSGIRRAIERRLSRHAIPEIPGLLDSVRRRIIARRDRRDREEDLASEMRYVLDEDDHVLLRAALAFLDKIVASKIATTAQLASIAKLQRAISRVPQVVDGLSLSVSVSSPRKKFGEIETWHWWEVEVDDDRLSIMSGGHFYRPGTGGDSFTTMTWAAVPDEPPEFDDYREELGIVPDVQAFPDAVDGIELAGGGYTLEVVDSENSLLEELQDTEEDDLEDCDFEDDEFDQVDYEDPGMNAERSPTWSVEPIDALEGSLAALVDPQQVDANEPTYAFRVQDCDRCGCALAPRGLFVDGRARDDLIWGNMCVKCFSERGEGIGWGRGQLYAKQRDGRWRMVAGWAS